MNIPRPKLNVIELALFAAFVGILAYNGGVARTRFEWQPYLSREGYELKILENRFGRAHNSEHGEEWIIRDFFSDQRDGVFVDVGANHHQRFSNTYFLETTLGWSGVAIEPQIKFAGGWASGRPRTKFIPSLCLGRLEPRGHALRPIERPDCLSLTGVRGGGRRHQRQAGQGQHHNPR